MEQVEVFLIFTERLEQAGINYMATGSVASMLYGIPRFTHDLDLVIDLPSHQIAALEAAFPLDAFYCPPGEVLQIESRRPQRGHFNVIHHKTGFKADIYIHRKDELHAWGLARKSRIDLSEKKGLWSAPPEYVIVRKLEYYREGHSEKHLHDIAGMLEVSGDIIDQAIIQKWVEKMKLQEQWDAALQH
jgi:hypothetical protein